ncbi:MAG: DNA topoisomerase, partial [Clostridia bacterium]|nr:DNA topoisomerase [Clostridia bacterium]
TGTIIHWKPDNTIFTSIKIKKERFCDILKRQAVVNSGIKFVLRWQEENGEFSVSEYHYEQGIIDYVKEIAGDDCVTAPVYWEETVTGVVSNAGDGDDGEEFDEDTASTSDEYKLKMSVSFCITSKNTAVEYYHNSSYLEHGGSPEKAFQTAFVNAVDKYCRDNGKYNKNEDTKPTYKDILDCIVLVTNCFSNIISYENQTKKSISNKFIREEMSAFFKKNLEIYFTENPMEAERFVGRVLINKRSREQAEANRINIKKKLTGNVDISNRVEKFVGCRSKDPDVRELYIVEGDSAMTSCKLARDAEFQAIIPVRGKTLNCLKSTYDKIFSSDIITDLIRVIGCGVEVDKKIKGDIPRFDADNLRWKRIIICTDADEDGFQIRTLLLTMIYRLLPSLIKMDKIFIAESPLFEITTKEKIYFAYDEREKVKILKEIEGKKYTIQRSKGLGENEADMMSLTTMSPATRRLVKVTEADAEETAEIFDTLLGDNIVARKKYIADNGSKYLAEADI